MANNRSFTTDDGHGLPGDLAFYTTLAKQSKQPVLELGCGAGRVALAIAEAGVPVVGLDADATRLELARRRSRDGANPRWVQADMRDFALSERFGLVVVPYRSLQLLTTPVECVRVFDLARDHLVSGGRLAFNISNIPALVETALRSTRAVHRHVATGALLPLRAGEVRLLLERAGLRPWGLFGGFSDEPFTEESSEQVWIAEAPEATLRPVDRSDR